LPPLDEFQVGQLIGAVQASVPIRFGLTASLEHRVALEAVEVSRYLPQAMGRPSLAGAMSCLEQQQIHQPLGTFPQQVPRRPTAPIAPAPSRTFLRRVSGVLPSPPTGGFPPPLPSALQPVHFVNSGLVNSARLRNFVNPSVFRTSSSARGPPPPCSSCGASGHDALQCPHGLDVSAVVSAAQELGRASQQRVLELSGNSQQGDLEASRVVREEVVSAISEISGISPLDISSHLDGGSGDAEATFVSAVCHSRGEPDSQFYNDACTRELHRRRRSNQIADASRLAASAPNNEAAYRSLASRVNLPSQLGYDYRSASGEGLQLPPPPSKPVNLRRRRRSDSDLSDFVVDDHSSDPDGSASPPRRRRRNSPSSDSDHSDQSSVGGSSDAGDSRSHSRQSVGEDDNGDGDDCGDSSGGDGSSGNDSDSEREEIASARSARKAASAGRNPDTPLTSESLSKILKTLLDKRGRSDNNGLLASKTPSFWDLGKAPVGGVFCSNLLESLWRVQTVQKCFRQADRGHLQESYYGGYDPHDP